MADASYDVVIAGGGYKGMVAAMYLSKYSGLSVGIFEEKPELGSGGHCTEESAAPGFLVNPCSSVHLREYHRVVYEDFPEFEEYGAKPIGHLMSSAAVFPEDGRAIGVYDAYEIDPTQEKTAEIIARFSQKDAEKWLWLHDKIVTKWDPVLRRDAWNPPPRLGQPMPIEELLADPDSGFDPHWTVMSYTQVLDELFESQEIKQPLAEFSHSQGGDPDGIGSGMLIPLQLWSHTSQITYAGGTHAVVHAAQRILLENGAKTFTQHEVKKIIIENGRAKGVRLADGTEIEAKLAVLANVDPHQLCFELVGEEYLGPVIAGKISRIRMDWTTISWYQWALNERPRYIGEDFLPDVYKSGFIALREKGWQSLKNQGYRRKLGMLPDPNHLGLAVTDHSYLTEAGYAPPGKASILTEQWVIPAHLMDEKAWKEYEPVLADQILSWWRRYAPNMTWDNVIAYVPITPWSIAQHSKTWGPAGNWAVIDKSPDQLGRWRPIYEWSDHRIRPITSLYGTGCGWQGIGASSMQGYNVYKTMAEDLGLSKPWEEKGRDY